MFSAVLVVADYYDDWLHFHAQYTHRNTEMKALEDGDHTLDSESLTHKLRHG